MSDVTAKAPAKTDWEIAQEAKLLPIQDIGAKLGIPADSLEHFGRYKAKIDMGFIQDCFANRPDGKLILVTAINPTPAGEGKTTTTVGLGVALNRRGKKTAICLREPSLGPVLRHEGWCCRRGSFAGRAHG